MAKRSEALSVIMNYLEMQGRTDEIAMYILDSLEFEVGMLPPHEHSDHTHIYDSFHVWEEEDE